MKNSAKFSGLIICLFLMVSAVAFADKGPVVKKSGNITYIDIGIYQPNVEDCYEMSVPDLGKDNSWINIYPNPNPGQFTLDLNIHQPDKSLAIHIYDVTGKVVFVSMEETEGNLFRKDLDVSILNKGIYFIRITGKDRVGVQQIIIN